jgi:hypothetical protein
MLPIDHNVGVGVESPHRAAKGEPQQEISKMRHAQKMMCVSVSAIVVSGLIASGCETTYPKNTAPAQTGPKDQREATVSYIKGLCRLTKEARDPTVRELNEALLPNHAAISCGRGGEL